MYAIRTGNYRRYLRMLRQAGQEDGLLGQGVLRNSFAPVFPTDSVAFLGGLPGLRRFRERMAVFPEFGYNSPSVWRKGSFDLDLN